jgi:hypothetical protein
MKIKARFLAISTLAAICTLPTLGISKSKDTRVHVRHARSELLRAMSDLEGDGLPYAGHRAKALEDVKLALDELKTALDLPSADATR